MTTNDTAELPVDGVHPPGAPPPARVARAARAVSGTVTAGLVVLAAVLWAAAVLAGSRPGPGAGALAGHTTVAVLAVALQVVAERRRGMLTGLAALAVLVMAAGTLWFWWWN
jgi:hypothetical protein